jgi:hypothetical protein
MIEVKKAFLGFIFALLVPGGVTPAQGEPLAKCLNARLRALQKSESPAPVRYSDHPANIRVRLSLEKALNAPIPAETLVRLNR